MKYCIISLVGAICFPHKLSAAFHNITTYPLYTVVPFIGTLFTIALAPLLLPKFWHRHYGKIISVWPTALIAILIEHTSLKSLQVMIINTLVHEFVPFIIMIGTLYIVSGGIVLQVKGEASPWRNTMYLLGTSAMSSVIGTTGAAILFIRPFLKLNANRSQRYHLSIFFIFLVCNIGGGLTVVGDPPLFLGYLNGIPFLWPPQNMVLPFCVSTSFLLILFYGLDQYYFRQESLKLTPHDVIRLSITGWTNICLLGGVLGIILISGQNFIRGSLQYYGIQISYQSLIRDGLMIIISLISLYITPRRWRNQNGFTWAPLIEITKIFAAIFVTASPVLLMLQAGTQGQFAFLTHFINDNQHIQNTLYFWISGLLSAFLDNAPTYLIFFNLAGGNSDLLTSTLNTTLLAFSMGSVFMGALTYIGNAPNFIVKAVAEENKIKMPSFFGYMGWSSVCLLPLFALLNIIFLKSP